MKKALMESLGCFSFWEQVKLICSLILLKIKIKLPPGLQPLFRELNGYTDLIEKQVSIKRINAQLLQFSFQMNAKPFTINIRRKSSDVGVFISVILNQEYRAVVDHFLQSGRAVKNIIDAGANIGCTSLYLAAYFPDALILAIEPDAQNAGMCKKNCELNKLEQVSILQHALWINTNKLSLDNSFRDGMEWSVSVNETNGSSTRQVGGITLDALKTQFNNERIDILKIDIEGGEKKLFEDESFIETVNTAVNALVIEIHDEFNIRETINSKMLQIGFVQFDVGDITLYSKK